MSNLAMERAGTSKLQSDRTAFLPTDQRFHSSTTGR